MRKINDPNYKVIPGEVTDYELALLKRVQRKTNKAARKRA